MTEQHSLVVVREFPYYAIDETLPEARARYKRLSGKFPSKKASIIALSGKLETLWRISVDDMGTLNYSKELTKIVLQ